MRAHGGYFMKRIISLLLAAVLTALIFSSFAGCGKKEGKPDGTDTSDKASESSGNLTDGGEKNENVSDVLELLTKVWNSYSDDEKFPAMGGDFSEENMTDGAPGRYGIEDAEALDYNFCLPAASVPLIDDAASLVHMMNANTFTCGAFHLRDKKDISDFAASLSGAISERQWICGFPDKYVIISVDDYVISAFGHEDPVNTLKAKVTDIYKSASVLYDAPLNTD